MGQMIFRSYIYPITVPEDVMFLAYWNKNKDLIITAIGKNEFGPEFGDELLSESRSEPLLEKKDDDQVALSETSSELVG